MQWACGVNLLELNTALWHAELTTYRGHMKKEELTFPKEDGRAGLLSLPGKNSLAWVPSAQQNTGEEGKEVLPD